MKQVGGGGGDPEGREHLLLKHLVVDLTLDKRLLQDVLVKAFSAWAGRDSVPLVHRDRLKQERGVPKSLLYVNGCELISQAMDLWGMTQMV